MWIRKNVWAIGGLREIGFLENSDVLMVLSSQGRGIFNCLTAERIERDSRDYYTNKWNPENGNVKGVGEYENENFICGGFEYPDILSKETSDGFTTEIKTKKFKFLFPEDANAGTLFIHSPDKKMKIEIAQSDYGFDRAYGFSPTGKSFVFSTSSEIEFWIRAEQ